MSSAVSPAFKKRLFDMKKKPTRDSNCISLASPNHYFHMTEEHMTPEADELWLWFLVHRVHKKNTEAPDLLTSQRSRCLLLRKSNHCTLTAPDRISLNSIRFNRIRIKSSLEHLLSLPPWQEEQGLLPLAGLPSLLWFTVIELSQDPLGDWWQDCHQNNPQGDTKSISN